MQGEEESKDEEFLKSIEIEYFIDFKGINGRYNRWMTEHFFQINLDEIDR